MSNDAPLFSAEVEAQLRREELSRRKVARVKPDTTCMDGLRASLEARLRGERGTSFEELQWKTKGA